MVSSLAKARSWPASVASTSYTWSRATPSAISAHSRLTCGRLRIARLPGKESTSKKSAIEAGAPPWIVSVL